MFHWSDVGFNCSGRGVSDKSLFIVSDLLSGLLGIMHLIDIDLIALGAKSIDLVTQRWSDHIQESSLFTAKRRTMLEPYPLAHCFTGNEVCVSGSIPGESLGRRVHLLKITVGRSVSDCRRSPSSLRVSIHPPNTLYR